VGVGKCRRDRQELREPASRGEIWFRRTGINTGHSRNSNRDSPILNPQRSPEVHKSRLQVASATIFCTVAPNICKPSVWNLVSRHTSGT
jgi:hypothetical protein